MSYKSINFKRRQIRHKLIRYQTEGSGIRKTLKVKELIRQFLKLENLLTTNLKIED